jgi:hypothetical protein
MKTYAFNYQGYDCFVNDHRGFREFAQLDVVDPNVSDRRRTISVSFLNSLDVIPDGPELVNYMLAQDEVKNMLDRIVENGFPENYNEGEV